MLTSLTKPSCKEGRLQVILQRAFEAGLRCPTEQALKVINSTRLVATEPDAVIDSSSVQQKPSLFEFCFCLAD